MTSTLVKGTALAAAIAVGALAFSAPAEAGRRHHHHGAAGLFAGLALGAIIGGAVTREHYYYAPPPAYYPPPPPAYYGYGPAPYAPPVAYAPAPWTPDWFSYCHSKYRSFDPRDGTFQPYEGPRRLCQ